VNDTAIEWTDYTWNPTTGCSPVSAGCEHCYARRMAQRLRGRFGYPADEPFRVTLHPERLHEPVGMRKPARIFVVSMGDLFHEDVPDSFIDRVFAVMAVAQQHTFQVLTKRPERMLRWFTQTAFGATREALVYEATKKSRWPGWPLSNVWLGVSCENQAAADERVPILLQTPAAVRWVSCEPLLGPIELASYFPEHDYRPTYDYYRAVYPGIADKPVVIRPGIEWVVVGGETGPGARPMHPDWVRSLRDQCQAAGVPFYFKSWGEWLSPYARGNGCEDLAGPRLHIYADGIGTDVVRVGRKRAGRLLDGRTWDEYPGGQRTCDATLASKASSS